MPEMTIESKSRFDAMLPGIPVTSDMRSKISAIAQAHNASMASVVRKALDVFLSEDAKILSTDDKGNAQS